MLSHTSDMQDFFRFLKDDGALLRASDARWLLVPSETRSLYHSAAVDGAEQGEGADEGTHLDARTHIHGLRIACPEEAIEIGEGSGLTVGRGSDAAVSLDSPAVRPSFQPLLHNTDFECLKAQP